MTNDRDIADDEPLSVPSASGASFMRDSSRPLDVAGFDPYAFIGGVRPTRRTVKVHERGDLIGVLDEIVNRIDAAPETENVDELIAQYEQARDAFQSGVSYWTVERRSSEWVTERWATYARAHGITLDREGDTADQKARLQLLTDQLVGQVVEVKDSGGQVIEANVSHDRLRELYDRNEGEFNKLLYAMSDANTSMAQQAKVLTRDFSLRSSTARSGSAS